MTATAIINNCSVSLETETNNYDPCDGKTLNEVQLTATVDGETFSFAVAQFYPGEVIAERHFDGFLDSYIEDTCDVRALTSALGLDGTDTDDITTVLNAIHAVLRPSYGA